ncbi:MAG: BRO family protein [Trichodesmium sp. St17_bin3_1_1]|nr:BRO family protein [Trichodesmium sp. St17_bin3_1_1]
MENNQTFHFQGKEIQIKVVNNEPWFLAADIAKALAVKDTSRMIDNARVKENEKNIFPNKTRGGEQKQIFVTRLGLKKVLANSKKANAAQLSESLGLEMCIYTKVEASHIGNIRKAFKDILSIDEYAVGKYNVDLYFPSLNLVIECDQNNHNHYNKQAEKKRKNYIKNKLGCTFIRFNPDKPGFMIGDVIYEISKFIENHKF